MNNQPNYDISSLFMLSDSLETSSQPAHRHSAIEIIMPLKGECAVKVSGRERKLSEFDIIIIPSGETHEIFAPKTQGRLVLRFDFALLQAIRSLADASFIFYKPRLITPEKNPELHRAVKSILLDCLEEYDKKREYYEANITAKLIGLAVLIHREDATNAEILSTSEIPPIRKKAHMVNFNRCIEYINRHYKDELSLEYVSGVAGFSKFHFTRWFKSLSGMSFYEYLTRVRIRVAEIMLASSEAPITEIALESGFQSIATFNRVFKSQKKITPTAFRQSASANIQSAVET